MSHIELPVRHYRLFPGDAPLGEISTSVTADLRRTALLLVDVYHAAASPASEDLVNHRWDDQFRHIVDDSLVPLVDAARDIGIPVIYAMNSSPNIAMDRSAFGGRLRESLGFDPAVDFAEPHVDPLEYASGEPVQLVIPPGLAPQSGDYYVRKHTYSGFFETRLNSVLRNLDARTLLCAGFALDCCVLFTLADAVFRNYQPILIRDGSLAAELPDEVDTFAHTRRTITGIECFLCPSATATDVAKALTEAGPVPQRKG